ncbi:S-adenosylmethionine-diacylglycerol 3-amino-3-carboxypropyl transferase, partial [Durusdinium trenchii]
ITAVDLNRAHVALGRLKLAAAKHFPNYETFYRFFGEADEKANVAAYERFLKANLDPETIHYWEGRDLANWGRKRITLFSRDLYHHGLLGYCIGAGHLVARLYGIDPKHMVRAKSLEEQRSFFDTALAPLFDKRLGLVYPQIWEDPDVDMRALRLTPESRMVTIASGGCNVMSYLTANPAEITAVDLNRAHVALGRLKLAAAKHFPNYETFYRFFGEADEKANVAAYERFLKANLDPETIHYWEGRDLANWGRKRITLFSRDLYHHGLLGYCIGAGHLVARLYGIDPKHMVRAKSLEEQ